MQAKYVLLASAAMLGLSLGGQAAYAGAGSTNASFGQPVVQASRLLTPVAGHGAGGGAIFWPTGTPYGPIHSYRDKPQRYSSSRHLYRRVNGR